MDEPLIAAAGAASRAIAYPPRTTLKPEAANRAARRARRDRPTVRRYWRTLTATRSVARAIVPTSLRHTGVTIAAPYPTATAARTSLDESRPVGYARTRWTTGPRWR